MITSESTISMVSNNWLLWAMITAITNDYDNYGAATHHWLIVHVLPDPRSHPISSLSMFTTMAFATILQTQLLEKTHPVVISQWIDMKHIPNIYGQILKMFTGQTWQRPWLEVVTPFFCIQSLSRPRVVSWIWMRSCRVGTGLGRGCMCPWMVQSLGVGAFITHWMGPIHILIPIMFKYVQFSSDANLC